jgi:hypothetical protein
LWPHCPTKGAANLGEIWRPDWGWEKRALRELYSTIHCISRRAEREGKEGSFEGHLSFMEGLQKHTCDMSKKVEPLREVQRLEEEDWERFVAKCKSSKFVANSEYMWQLRAQNELNHHLGNTGYTGK